MQVKVPLAVLGLLHEARVYITTVDISYHVIGHPSLVDATKLRNKAVQKLKVSVRCQHELCNVERILYTQFEKRVVSARRGLGSWVRWEPKCKKYRLGNLLVRSPNDDVPLVDTSSIRAWEFMRQERERCSSTRLWLFSVSLFTLTLSSSCTG